jgi:YrbI family 3-deoxy-D-manno-octulosonate 8-phosphate phosphatase
MSLVALVPARGGSKGIPGKNIRDFAGRPLLYWVCKAAQDCPEIDAVYVSTDSEEIAAVALGLGLSKLQVIARAPGTATDTASTESVMLDFAERVPFDHIALLQATSPLLESAQLSRACQRVLSGACDSVLSVVPQKRFYWKLGPDGSAAPLNYDPLARPRRQDHEGTLVENGAFYVTTRAGLLASRCRLSGRIEVVEMPEESYFEIDEASDWTIAEALLRARSRRADTLLERLRNIRLVATDVDGCLTDSGMYYGEQGDELKKFNTRDGLAFRRLQEAGFHTAIITQENTLLMRRRATKVRVDDLYQGADDKCGCMAELLEKHGIAWEQVAYLGDDLGDLALLKKVGFAACPADAMPPIREVAMAMRARGGEGAFREMAEIILAANPELPRAQGDEL